MSVKFFSCSLVLYFSLTSAVGPGSETSLQQGPRDCGDVYLSGGQYEDYYVIFPNPIKPDEADLAYCSIKDGFLSRNGSIPRTNAKNCQDLKDGGMSESGLNVIYPYLDHAESPILVYCDQSTLNGGWTVFQRRDVYPTQLDFYKSSDEYSLGFGNVGTEFWLGNDILHELTQQSVSELYVELTSFDGVTKYALYNMFNVGNKTAYDGPFALTLEHYSGTAGDSLARHNGMAFSTFDEDNDECDTYNCAESFKGGWWYSRRTCYGGRGANLNGVHFAEAEHNDQSAFWWFFSSGSYSLKKIVMMTRGLKQQ
ncbi:unnamed protein product [Meganyctiphanes norvegica]|uniref:Fibrinogen C-terminal domain-containing protein n=1 Tax=Meganyctiphanes norvegica TaxID=48144 RepID=A0AAV2SJH0_MEGNR